MMKSSVKFDVHSLNQDIPAGIVVFLVALPLCLGIALASGAPLFSGITSGIVGGVVVAWCSGSQVSVSGPAAGLSVIVLNGIESLGSFDGLLVSLVLAGLFQLALGFCKAGSIGAFFPTSVIKGMLAAIGLILMIKQIPHATGHDSSLEGDEGYMLESASSSFFELIDAVDKISPGATLISCISLLLLIGWENRFLRGFRLVRTIPGPLIVVLFGVGFNEWAQLFAPEWAVSEKHLVSLPELGSASNFMAKLHSPDFSYLSNINAYTIALSLALVASLESLLSLEAVDRLDPMKRIAPTNQELKAQGLGNIICGLIGGLPISALIVRSAANINAGAKTRWASFVHGVLLAICVVFFTQYLNTIPLACLAAILLQTAYKLVNPKIIIEYYQRGWNQFLPFAITIVAILISDLLIGIMIGMATGIFFVLRANFHAATALTQHGPNFLLRLHKDVSFLNKALLRQQLTSIPDNSELLIDGSKALFIDPDILESIADFLLFASERGISVELQGIYIANHTQTKAIHSPAIK